MLTSIALILLLGLFLEAAIMGSVIAAVSAEVFLFVLVGATVQAAIGAIPLTMGLDCGKTVLTVAVLSILITAPFGTICIDNLYKKLL